MHRLVYVSAGALAFGLLATSPSRAHQAVTSVTWVDDIEPIVESRCLPCHGVPARSSLRLDSYAFAHDAARRIKREVLEKRMPPWPAAPGFGDYENDPSLSAVEMELIAAWADGGAPKGTGPDREPRTRDDRARRDADLVLRIPVAAGSDRAASRTIQLSTERATDAWIEAWEFRPGNPAIVEQAELSFVGGEPIGVWVPPEAIVRFPAGVAQHLPAHARVSLKIFYKKSSSPDRDGDTIAFYFADVPTAAVRHRRLSCGSSVLPNGIGVIAIRPTLARSGEWIEAVAHEPGGRVQVLVWVPDYVLRFEPAYRFRTPLALPRGTDIELRSFEDDCAADLTYVAR